MIKIYGMPTCPYCDYVHEQIKGRESEYQYINIGENIRNMSESPDSVIKALSLITARRSGMLGFRHLYLRMEGYP